MCVFAPPEQALTLRLCLNGEPFLTLEPADDGVHAPAPARTTSAAAAAAAYRVRRHRHPAGHVTCACLDEVVSLPPRAALAVHYTSGTPATVAAASCGLD